MEAGVLGVYSDVGLSYLISKGFIRSKKKIKTGKKGQIQPSGLDTRIGDKIWCMPSSAIPNGSIEDYLKANCHYRLDLKRNNFLHRGFTYISELMESVKLPPFIGALSNPKSSVGRTDIHVRLLTNRGEYFDSISAGYKGKLYLEIQSRSFNIRLKKGESLNQIRFFSKGIEELNDSELEVLSMENPILFDRNDNIIEPGRFIENGAINFTLDLEGDEPGYVARTDAPVVDLSRRDNPFSEYFDSIKVKEDESVDIVKDLFYLLLSSERIKIPASHCGEMVDVSTRSGDFRAHYAGLFDPAFNGRAVLEVRNPEESRKIYNGGCITSIKLYPLRSKPKKGYGSSIGSHFQDQVLIRPAKYFDKTA